WKNFGNGWKVRLNTSAWHADVNYARGFFFSPPGPPSSDPLIVPQAVTSTIPNVLRQYSLDLTLTGGYSLFAREGELALGIDSSLPRYEAGQAIYLFFDPPATTVSAYHPALYPDPRQTQEPFLTSRLAVDVKQFGLFAASRYHLSDAWSIVAGARISRDRAQ